MTYRTVPMKCWPLVDELDLIEFHGPSYPGDEGWYVVVDRRSGRAGVVDVGDLAMAMWGDHA